MKRILVIDMELVLKFEAMLKWSLLVGIAVMCGCVDMTQPEKETLPEKDNLHAKHKTSFDAEQYIKQLNDGLIAEDTLKGSPMRIAMGDIGKAHIHIAYSAPGVKGRVVWGGVVAYNKVWATGAHMATSIIFTEPILFNNIEVPTGCYALFTIPQKDGEWTIILNKNYDQHLADDYDEKEDVLRIKVNANILKRTVERLTYSVVNKDTDNGTLHIEWEKLRLSIPLKAI